MKAKQPTTKWWLNGIFVVYVHIMALASVALYRPSLKPVLIAFAIWFASNIGITMGYHRLWSHRSYEASFCLRLILAIFGTAGFQGSIKWWCQRHRLHHRFTDSQHDPYNAKRGFWFSHMGWIFEKPYYPKLSLVDISDLMKDPIVRLQHKWYVPLAIIVGFVFPVVVSASCGLNPFLDGFLFLGHFTKLLIWHGTFSINSFAHLIGSQDYSIEFTAKGNLLLAIATSGEGHHNFHHEFPYDYRNGVKWYHYDPTKWLIKMAQIVGLARNLKTSRDEDIKKAMIVTAERKLILEKEKIDWGPNIKELPKWTRGKVADRNTLPERCLIIIDRVVYDVTSFLSRHPGGVGFLKSYDRKDATTAFNGGLNSHTQSARIIAMPLAIATINDE